MYWPKNNNTEFRILHVIAMPKSMYLSYIRAGHYFYSQSFFNLKLINLKSKFSTFLYYNNPGLLKLRSDSSVVHLRLLCIVHVFYLLFMFYRFDRSLSFSDLKDKLKKETLYLLKEKHCTANSACNETERTLVIISLYMNILTFKQ